MELQLSELIVAVDQRQFSIISLHACNNPEILKYISRQHILLAMIATQLRQTRDKTLLEYLHSLPRNTHTISNQ